MTDDLIERLKAMHVDPIGCGLERRWLRNPDGPAAAHEIERLRATVAAAEAERDAARALLQNCKKAPPSPPWYASQPTPRRKST